MTQSTAKIIEGHLIDTTSGEDYGHVPDEEMGLIPASDASLVPARRERVLKQYEGLTDIKSIKPSDLCKRLASITAYTAPERYGQLQDYVGKPITLCGAAMVTIPFYHSKKDIGTEMEGQLRPGYDFGVIKLAVKKVVDEKMVDGYELIKVSARQPLELIEYIFVPALG